MSEAGSAPLCIVDTNGLHDIAGETSGNLKAALFDQLKSGVIGVPACVWQEYQDLFPDEAELLADHITKTIPLRKRAYTAKAGSLADKLNSGFSRGPYDEGTDLYVAAIASVEKCGVLTAKGQLDVYAKMKITNVTDLGSWLADMDD